jgi:hypothetical protein
MFSYNFTKSVYLEQLNLEIQANTALKAKYANASALGTSLVVNFNIELTSEEQTSLEGIVTAHTGATSAQQLSAYLDIQVFPFIQNLIRTFAAENISMGITQAGKTGDVLGLFEKQYTIAGISKPVSLKASFDTGSLYVSRSIIQHVRDNPTEYDGLSPFITDSRLLSMKNSIETFLGLPLSV